MYDYIIEKPDLEDALVHYGVKGMKWHHKKGNSGKHPNRYKRNAPSLTNKGYPSAEGDYNPYAYVNTRTGKIDAQGKIYKNNGTKWLTRDRYNSINDGVSGVDRGISAGRMRKAKKEQEERQKNSDFVERGIAAGRERAKKRKKK